MCGICIIPSRRYYHLGKINAGNRKIDLIYTDSGSDSMVGFEKHEIYLYVMCR